MNRNRKNKLRDRFYESMPEAYNRQVVVAPYLGGKRTVSFTVGLGLLFIGMAGLWDGLQVDGRILGMFAFNVWTTTLALIAGLTAIWAAFYPIRASTAWNTLAAGFAVLAVAGILSGLEPMFGVFANNFNNVIAYFILTAIFGYLGLSRTAD